MRVASEKREHSRTRVNIGVLCSSGIERGSGVLADISLSGALIDETSLRPRLGAPVKIRFDLAGSDSPIELVGAVVRHTPSGFALQFATSEQIVGQLLDRGILLPKK